MRDTGGNAFFLGYGRFHDLPLLRVFVGPSIVVTSKWRHPLDGTRWARQDVASKDGCSAPLPDERPLEAEQGER
ncbi:hypothetical protein JCM17961_49230 [Endothiovibrio diazotrophicus]